MPIPLAGSETAEPQTLDVIREWNRGLTEALLDQRASVLHAIQVGIAVLPRFAGMTDEDINAYYDSARRELDRLTVLNLVASAEASLKSDFFRRVREKLKDQLSRSYQDWHAGLSPQKQLRPDFDEGGILEVLKGTHLIDNHVVGQYRECLRARHWLGHGRFWSKPLVVDALDPDEVYDRAKALLQALPA